MVRLEDIGELIAEPLKLRFFSCRLGTLVATPAVLFKALETRLRALLRLAGDWSTGLRAASGGWGS